MDHRTDHLPEKIEVRVANVEDRLQNSGALCGREPAQENSSYKEVVVDLKEIDKTADNHVLRDRVAWDGRRTDGTLHILSAKTNGDQPPSKIEKLV
jgi:hypothetical protein